MIIRVPTFIFLLCALVISVVAFQNCAGDFDVGAYQDLSSLQEDPVARAKPVILSSSPDANIASGQPVVFYATASGGGLSYVWKKNGVAIINSSNVLNLPAAKAADAGTYVIEISNSFGMVPETFVLAVGPDPTPTPPGATPTPTPPPATTAPVITTPPHDIYALRAQTVAFQVVAQGATSYQWYVTKNSVGTETIITGATLSTYSLTASLSAAGKYRVEVRNAAGVVSASAYLYIETFDFQ